MGHGSGIFFDAGRVGHCCGRGRPHSGQASLCWFGIWLLELLWSLEFGVWSFPSMDLTRRSLLVYGLLVAMWGLVVAWQVEEHVRFREYEKSALRRRSKSI